MQFHSDGKIYKAVRITGPTHNYLGLELDAEEVNPIIVEPLRIGDAEPVRHVVEDVRNSVLRGVAEANRALDTEFKVKRIQFVVNDSPPVDVYAHLAWEILKRLHEKGSSFNGAT